jgi:hypothetical protein
MQRDPQTEGRLPLIGGRFALLGTSLQASDLSSSMNIRHVFPVVVSSRMLNEPLAFIVIE